MFLASTASLVTMIICLLRLGSASEDEAGCTHRRVSIVPSSGPTIYLPLDEYMRLVSADTDAKSASQESGRRELVYRYMSPTWLNTSANFSETPSSVSTQAVEFGSGSLSHGLLFKASLIDAGVLDDAKRYVIHIGLYFSNPPDADDSDPSFVVCDSNGSYCVGFQYDNSGLSVYYFAGRNFGAVCQMTEFGHVADSTPGDVQWNMRIELHPTYTVGLTYAGTSKILTHQYDETLKPSQGLSFRVCRESEPEQFVFYLFELTVRA
ncbi:uncharacterized protein [Oscarella lobularis]|uniref:uncharacterized protein isoform X2 n=1 Tax=Oscarella lobularis TaxID=121494 RepID=UPI003314326B